MSLRQKPYAVTCAQMSVEMTRENAVEAHVGEGKREGVSLEESGLRAALARDREHGRALVDPCDLAAQVAGEEASATRDVKHAPRRKRLDHVDEARELLVPARTLDSLVLPAAEIPIVVLGRAQLVVPALLGSHVTSVPAGGVRPNPQPPPKGVRPGYLRKGSTKGVRPRYVSVSGMQRKARRRAVCATRVTLSRAFPNGV
jgi:hypothetical protein